MTEVRVDFNARGPRGLVKASQRRADAELHVGDGVLAVDRDEDLAFPARVESIDEATGRVWLDVCWAEEEPVASLGAVPGGVLIVQSHVFAASQVVPSFMPSGLPQPAAVGGRTAPAAAPISA